MIPQITSLFVYPVKSMGAVGLECAELNEGGFRYDRQWMMVDENGRFVSQREIRALSLMHCHLTDHHLELRFEGKGSVAVSLDAVESEPVPVQVWDEKCWAVEESREAHDFLSACFGASFRLVRMSTQRPRLLEPAFINHSSHRVHMHFGDSQPLHLCSLDSLAELNSRLQQPIPVSRFRPNIVVQGLPPFHEDRLQSFTCRGTRFRFAKQTGRCVMIGIDQTTSAQNSEPLEVLASYRKHGHRIAFGCYFIHDAVGSSLHVGDSLEECHFVDLISA